MSDYEQQEQRILKIFDNKKIPRVSDRSLKTYLKYLKSNLQMPCQLTGIEDFDWEEFYVFGPGSKKEYEQLKKSQPSYTDKYELIDFEDEVDEFYGVMVTVKRLSDRKKFELPLADLEATEKKSSNYQLLDDYSVWFVNNR